MPTTVISPSLTLKRHFNAPPAKVYAAWTDPTQIARWMGSDRVTVVSADTDVRVGGRYAVAMRSGDGEEHNVSGVYREIEPDRRLVFTWAWRSTPERESLVTVTFKPDGDGTMLTLTHEKFFDEAARDRHREGWSGSLDQLERLFT